MFETLFVASFFFGLFFTLLTALLGASHLGGDGLHLHPDVGSDAHLAWFPAQLNLTALMTFFTWFGATGWLMLRFAPFGWPGALVAAVPAGMVGYTIIASFYGMLRRSGKAARAEDYVLAGTVARVTVPAGENGVGEIVFMLQGVQRVEGARTSDGLPLAKGVEVVITGFERGLAVVQDARTFIQELPDAPLVRHAEPESET